LRALATPLVLLLAGPVATPLQADNGTIVALALDTSGSIGPEGLNRARELAGGVLAELGPGSEAAVFTFDDRSRLIQDRTSQAAELGRALAGVKMSGRYTALYDALYDASRYLRDAPGSRKAIVLLTDGHDENSALTVEDGLKVAEESNIPVYAVGVGNVDERVLRRIAKLTGGEYFPPGSANAAALASRIGTGPASPEAAERPATGAESAPVPAVHAPSTSPRADAPAPSRGGRRGLWMGLGAALLALGGLGWLVLGRRSPAAPPPGAAASGPAAPSSDAGSRTLVTDTAPTILARVGSATDEYLEKTVVLRERPVLSVTRGPGAGHVFEVKIGGATSVGRAKVNDIVLRDDVAVSSEHCRIRPEEGHFVIHDLKSTNGTFVNDHRVSRQPLAEGDTIQVGETYFQFRLEHRRS